MNDSKNTSIEVKLFKRIRREFTKCRYIGDIQISDEEYLILKDYCNLVFFKIRSSYDHTVIDRVFATGLVQMGIRFYDGGLWPHIKRELGLKQIPLNQQTWIGNSFYSTLTKYNKYHVEKGQIINNILLHCFVSNYYANDLFDFLFAYYQLDLERNLENHTKQMRDYLIQAMLKSDSSARAYKIRKHTADAVFLNERGCRIRVGKILRLIDNALFKNSLPLNAKNRISHLFCSWVSSSPLFTDEKKNSRGRGSNAENRFVSPYIHVEMAKRRVSLVLPPQYIRLTESEDLPLVSWHIIMDGTESSCFVDVRNLVTGCKTERSMIETPSFSLFDNIELELRKGANEVVRRFRIPSDDIRFFNKDWDLIDPIYYSTFLPPGQLFAFAKPNLTIATDSEAIVGSEHQMGLLLYNLSLEKGDILTISNGSVKTVGHPSEEGLMDNGLVDGAFVSMGKQSFKIFGSIPSLYITMKSGQEAGTLITINKKRIKFDTSKCVTLKAENPIVKQEYIIDLAHYIDCDGFYEVEVDIPKSMKNHSYHFAYIKGFAFSFEESPYIFATRGTVSVFGNDVSFQGKVQKGPYSHDFEIDPEKDYIDIPCLVAGQKTTISLYCPTFKWRFDNGNWNLLPPKDIWHRSLPSQIDIKYPCDNILLHMISKDSSLQFCNNTDIECSKSSLDDMFTIDTRRLLTWLSLCSSECVISIKACNRDFPFFTVLMKNRIDSFYVTGDDDASQLIIQASVSGNESMAIDVLLNGQTIAEKEPFRNGSAKVTCELLSGMYEVVFYSCLEDEFFGGEEYSEICRKRSQYINPWNMTGRIIKPVCATPTFETGDGYSNHSLELNRDYIISNLQRLDDEKWVYMGEMYSKDGIFYREQVKVEFFNPSDLQKVWISFQEDTDDWCGFYYDNVQKKIVPEPDSHLPKSTQYRRYSHILFPQDYVYSISFCEPDSIDLSKYKKRQPLSNSFTWKRSSEGTQRNEHRIDDLHLSVRTTNSLKSAGLLTLESILIYRTENLLKVRNLGQKGVDEVIATLKKYGMIE